MVRSFAGLPAGCSGAHGCGSSRRWRTGERKTGRALLLAELAAPASTTDPARRTGLAAGGVSQHLTAMRAAGLVSAHRTGRVVLYARTSVGESLVAG